MLSNGNKSGFKGSRYGPPRHCEEHHDFSLGDEAIAQFYTAGSLSIHSRSNPGRLLHPAFGGVRNDALGLASLEYNRKVE